VALREDLRRVFLCTGYVPVSGFIDHGDLPHANPSIVVQEKNLSQNADAYVKLRAEKAR